MAFDAATLVTTKTEVRWRRAVGEYKRGNREPLAKLLDEGTRPSALACAFLAKLVRGNGVVPRSSRKLSRGGEIAIRSECRVFAGLVTLYPLSHIADAQRIEEAAARKLLNATRRKWRGDLARRFGVSDRTVREVWEDESRRIVGVKPRKLLKKAT